MKSQANDHQALKELADEIILFDGIQHPNLVQYHGVKVHRVRICYWYVGFIRYFTGFRILWVLQVPPFLQVPSPTSFCSHNHWLFVNTCTVSRPLFMVTLCCDFSVINKFNVPNFHNQISLSQNVIKRLKKCFLAKTLSQTTVQHLYIWIALSYPKLREHLVHQNLEY